MPSTVTVAAGATSASLTAKVATVTTAQTATLTASANSVTKTYALQLGVTATTTGPTLSVNTTSIAFGSVALNTPATQSVTLSSTGTADVTVSAVTISGTGFTVSECTIPLTLNSGKTETLIVQFDPTVAGAVSGSLTITSNSSTGSSIKVAVTGTGGRHPRPMR